MNSKNQYVYFWEISVPRSGHFFIKNNIESWLDNPFEFINLENFSPKDFPNHETICKLDPNIYSNSLKIIVLRDLLNWFTSYCFYSINNPPNVIRGIVPLLKHVKWEGEFIEKDLKDSGKLHIITNDWDKDDYLDYCHRPNRLLEDWNTEKRIKNLIEMWTQIAKEFLGITNYVKDSIEIYYDDFFRSKNYRKKICSRIGDNYNEKKLNYVPSAGSFSSIDSDLYQGRGQEMKTLERYKIWYTDEINRDFLNFLKGSEALDLYMNNFDVNEDKKKFIEWAILN
ncbi:MAG TPA: hypothetical protein VMV43_03745 [Candidatus Nanopelagicaceae bacterium]|nr:hypothetical protein [Candidatus Nanopelagicaceae bacterium]